MYILKASQIRLAEQHADASGYSFISLMENAGTACAGCIAADWRPGSKITSVCGQGKNGGDGLVIARVLKGMGYDVSVVLVSGVPKASDALVNYGRAKDAGVAFSDLSEDPSGAAALINDADAVADAVFGIGFHGVPDQNSAAAFELMNSSHAKIYAVDVPSGTGTDDSSISVPCVKADVTLCISVLKPCCTMYPSRALCGEVKVLDIGIPHEFFRDAHPDSEALTASEVKSMLVPRPDDSNKGTFGHALCVCGSGDMPGAAELCTLSACRSGAGLVTCASPKSAMPAISAHLQDALLCTLPETLEGGVSRLAVNRIQEQLSKATAVCCGCGLGNTRDSLQAVKFLIKNSNVPLVLDADALNAVSTDVSALKKARCKVILTPHPGEMARLCGTDIKNVLSDMTGTALELSHRTGCIVLLKGASTVITDGTRVFINTTGCSGMSKGGSGDVLTGIIVSLCAQGTDPFDAACIGAFIHGLAGQKAAEKYTQICMLASDIISSLPDAFRDIMNV